MIGCAEEEDATRVEAATLPRFANENRCAKCQRSWGSGCSTVRAAGGSRGSTSTGSVRAAPAGTSNRSYLQLNLLAPGVQVGASGGRLKRTSPHWSVPGMLPGGFPVSFSSSATVIGVAPGASE